MRDLAVLVGRSDAVRSLWDLVLEMGTGFSGAFARQVTLNKTSASDELTADLLAAFDAAADRSEKSVGYRIVRMASMTDGIAIADREASRTSGPVSTGAEACRWR